MSILELYKFLKESKRLKKLNIETYKTRAALLNSHNKSIKKYPNLAMFAFDRLGVEISLHGVYEKEILENLKSCVFDKIDTQNSVCLDIGANIGNHTLNFSQFFKQVYSFEPHPEIFQLLKFNIRNSKNVQIFEIGASNKNAGMILVSNQNTSYGSSQLSNKKNLSPDINISTFNVQVKKLDDLGSFGRGKSQHRPRDDAKLFLNGKYPLIQTGNVTNSNLYLSKHKFCYNDFGLRQSKLWDKGTLCITIAANIAETAILSYPMCFPDSVVGFSAYPKKTSEIFMHYVFTFIKKSLQESIVGSSIQDNINLEYLQSIEFRIPPIPIQDKINKILHSIDKKIENMIQDTIILERSKLVACNRYSSIMLLFSNASRAFSVIENGLIELDKTINKSKKKLSKEIKNEELDKEYSAEEVIKYIDGKLGGGFSIKNITKKDTLHVTYKLLLKILKVFLINESYEKIDEIFSKLNLLTTTIIDTHHYGNFNNLKIDDISELMDPINDLILELTNSSASRTVMDAQMDSSIPKWKPEIKLGGLEGSELENNHLLNVLSIKKRVSICYLLIIKSFEYYNFINSKLVKKIDHINRKIVVYEKLKIFLNLGFKISSKNLNIKSLKRIKGNIIKKMINKKKYFFLIISLKYEK